MPTTINESHGKQSGPIALGPEYQDGFRKKQSSLVHDLCPYARDNLSGSWEAAITLVVSAAILLAAIMHGFGSKLYIAVGLVTLGIIAFSFAVSLYFNSIVPTALFILAIVLVSALYYFGHESLASTVLAMIGTVGLIPYAIATVMSSGFIVRRYISLALWPRRKNDVIARITASNDLYGPIKTSLIERLENCRHPSEIDVWEIVHKERKWIDR